MGSNYDAVLGAMKEYSWGDQGYLRIITEEGGNAEYGIRGEIDYEDVPLTHIPIVQVASLSENTLSSQGTTDILIRRQFTIFFEDDITESAVQSATGLVLGGTFDPLKNQVVGGKFYLFDKTTYAPLDLDDDGVCACRIQGVLK